jgi:hypothetical protein
MTPVKSERAARIEAAIKQSSAKSEMGKHPIVIGGLKKMFEVYRLPTKLLAFNIRNGRFAAELRAKEKQLKRKLDPLEKADATEIRSLLLALDPHATLLLKNDLKSVGQTEPGIITHDGYVINGNRRMAILQELHSENSTGKFEYLEVHVLPSIVSEKDLWRIEAGLQLSRDKRLDYGPVNDLLKIREGLQSGLSAREIAATLYGVKDEHEVVEKDARLSLIDSYLEYVAAPEDYTRVNRSVEHFINLQNLLKHFEKQGVKGRERQKWMLIGFELIRAGMGHMDIRYLREIAASSAAKADFLNNIKFKEGARSATEERTAKENTTEQFRTAKDQVENESDAKKPIKLLNKAQRAIETLLSHKADLVAKKELHEDVKKLAGMLNTLVTACKSSKLAKK